MYIGQSRSNAGLELMASEQTMLKATFFAALIVMVLNFLALSANFLSYLDRERALGVAADLEKRVAALEEAQTQPPQLPREKGQPK